MVNLLITSPEGYAQRLVRAFEAPCAMSHFQLVSRPMIQTLTAIDTPLCHDFFLHLDDYDYVVFSSRKAIEAFALGLEKTGIQVPGSLRLCAIGKDNELLQERLHLQPDFISEEPSPMGIVRHLEQLPETNGKRIAVLAPEVVGMEEPRIVPDFIRGLENIGMVVSRINVYQTKAASAALLAQIAEELLRGTYDAVVFTSGTEIKVFQRLVSEGMVTADLWKRLTVICYGPYTAQCAAQYGVSVDFTSSSFGSFQGLAEQIRIFYKQDKN